MIKQQLQNINIDELVTIALPCPFCGEKPEFEKGYVPPYISLMCLNNECYIQPYLEIKVNCTKNEGNSETYSPQFNEHYEELLNKWNMRYDYNDK
jgi:hypothetical protein